MVSKNLSFKFRRFAVLLLAGFACLYVYFLADLYFNQAHHVYHPEKEWETTPAEAGLSYEDITLTSADGVKLSAWYVPVADAKGTVLIFHGNARNMASDMDVIEMFPSYGWNVLIIDYRGFGKSEGAPTEAGTYLDAQAAWDWLVTVKHEAPNRILIVGRSLGSAIAAELASQQNPGGLILEAAFTSLAAVGQEHYPIFPVKLLSRFHYDTLAYLKKVTCPVLIIHSRDDKVVKFHHAQELYAAVSGEKNLIEIGGPHQGGYKPTRGIYLRGVKDFLTAKSTHGL